MPDIIEEGGVFPSVPLLEKGWKIRGGDEAAEANLQAVALVQRTAFLKQQLENLGLKGIQVLGTLADFDALAAIDTTQVYNGTGYFIDGSLSVWNGHEWINSGKLAPPQDPAALLSADTGNELVAGSDGKLFLNTNPDEIDFVQIYTQAKES